jgi:hypothetical protein
LSGEPFLINDPAAEIQPYCLALPGASAFLPGL